MKVAKCAVLSTLVDLERNCTKQGLRITDETNAFMLKLFLKKLGRSSSQKLMKKLIASGELQYDESEEFEVETVLDHFKEGGQDFYLIKWSGWSNVHNSWEPQDNVGSEVIEVFNKSRSARTQAFHHSETIDARDEEINSMVDRFIRASKKITPLRLLEVSDCPFTHIRGVSATGRTRINKLTGPHRKQSKHFKERQATQQKALKDWQAEINKNNKDPAPVFVENNVDFEGPTDLYFIHDYRAGKGVELNDDPVIGCECADNCYDNQKNCCPESAGTAFPYFRWGRTRIHPGFPIYECNKMCTCGKDCPNRVVQRGRIHKLCIFRTPDGRGWGVKALQKIKKGSFVMEYLGEIITSEEAEERGKKYDAEGMTYLFDLDYQDAESVFTVDAGFYGNVAHFVNHSCDPNLVVFSVWVNNLDPRLPRIALFAKRDITRGEELTFDYSMKYDAYDETPADESSEDISDKTDSKPQQNGATEPEVNGDVGHTELAAAAAVTPTSHQLSPLRNSPLSPLQLPTSPSLFTHRASHSGKIVCLCKAPNCKKFIF